MSRKRMFLILVAALAALTLAFSQAALAGHIGLSAAGPVLPDTDPTPAWSAGYNGFPVWYRDKSGNVLTLTNPPTAANVPDAVDGANPFSVQIGFGSEAFYWLGTSTNTLATGGQALLVMGLESAFATGPAVDKDQMVFARVRIRIDAPVNGTYTVYHPYGVRTFNVDTVAKRNINETIDIGAAPLIFSGALKGAIGPFLKQSPPPADLTLIGDGVTNGPVTGSPETFPGAGGGPQNFFRIEGPAGSAIGGPGNDVFQSNNFVIDGKYFPGTPFTVLRATYYRDAAGNTTLVGFGKTFGPYAGETMSLNATGAAAPLAMTRRGVYFYGALALGNVAPSTLDFTATSVVNPATTLTRAVSALITITQADYSQGGGTVTITATSSDQFPGSGLTYRLSGAGSFGDRNITLGVATVIPVTIPPNVVQLVASDGTGKVWGSDSLKVNIVP